MLDFLILSILLVPTVLSEGGQWLALSYGHRTLNWLLPILFHGIAFAKIAREHWNYTGSELAATGGAGSAAAAGLLFAYAWISVNAFISVCLIPIWMKEVSLPQTS